MLIILILICASILSQSNSLLMFPQDSFLRTLVEFPSDCMRAMCEADSGCVPKGCDEDIHGRYGCGYFRLNIYHYKQCYQPGKEDDQDEEEAWLTCAENYECSQECLRRLSNRYKVKCYGKSDCETLARIHDGGANGCRSKDTLPYWNIVKQKCPHC